VDDLSVELRTLSSVKGRHRHCRVSSETYISLPLIGHGMISYYVACFLDLILFLFLETEGVLNHYERCSADTASCYHFSKIPKALSICNKL